MRFAVLPADFRVEELLRRPRRQAGPYTLYAVHKVGRTTLDVQVALARALGCAPSAVCFPALKDRQAAAVQYAAVRGEGPEEVRGRGWWARRVGRAGRPLRPSDLLGNRFTAVLRDLGPGEAAHLRACLEKVAACGLPNYFDEQRFGSYSPGGEWVGKLILCGEAEAALRAHLGQEMAGDPRPVRAFKAEARAHWGEWPRLLAAAPRPSNYRSVLVFLRDHPADFRRALNLVTPRVLSLYLAAYQSLLWNRLVGRFLSTQAAPAATLAIAGETLPLPGEVPAEVLAGWRNLRLPMPHHRAVYEGHWAGLYAQVLTEEGLQPADLKARLLRRAYLGAGERALLMFPADVSISEATPDERFPGRERMTVRFTLPPGSYGTLVLRAMGQMDRWQMASCSC